MRTKLIRADIGLWQQVNCHLAVYTACLARKMLRFLHRGATVFPGKVALRLVPNILSYLVSGRDLIFVTGTNGKTTTVRFLVKILEAAGFKVITNVSGANLTDGIVAAILEHYQDLINDNPNPTESKLVLVMEIDEAYYGKLGTQVPWLITVLTNLFRDQLDRYGELSTTRKLISKGLGCQADSNCKELAPSGRTFITCADDAMSMSLYRCHNGKILTFGTDAAAMKPGHPSKLGDGNFCYFCGRELQYSAYNYAHLGIFKCESCDFCHQPADLVFKPLTPEAGAVAEAAAATAGAADRSRNRNNYELTYAGEKAALHLCVGGRHNAYNAAAALLAATDYLHNKQIKDFSLQKMAASLSKIEAAFGRMERIELPDNKEICLILVKNPAGFNLAWDYLQEQSDLGGLCLALNSKVNDGKDVSWIWDISLETQGLQAADFAEIAGENYRIFLGGERALDLACRFYYAGFPAEHLQVEKDYNTLLDRAIAATPAGKCLYCLPNYTTMLAIRAALAAKYNLRDFWLED